MIVLQNTLQLKDIKCSSILEFATVLCSILLSKSLYYESYGDNKLLIPFLLCLLMVALGKNIAINKYVILYSLLISILAIVNIDSQFDSILVLLTRLGIAALIVSYISFEKFASIFIDVMSFISVLSLLYIIIIAFNVPSVFPDFVGITGLHLRNFIFFGVTENFITYNVIRNSGLWWEPGAFQIFVNLAFIFSLSLGSMNKKRYFLFLVTILSTESTTGILVFFMLSLIYFEQKTSRNKIVLLSTFVLIFVVALAFLFFFPKFIDKFNSMSFLGRYYDFIISYKLFMRDVLFGYGFGSQLEVAIPFGKELLGEVGYNKYPITGSDGITMLVAQGGMFMIFLLKPLLFPKYLENIKLFGKLIIFAVLVILFNTQNFVFILIFNILTFYGIVGIKKSNSLSPCIKNNLC